MEGGAAAAAATAEKASEPASYTYWVREVTPDAAPLSVPKKIDPAGLGNKSNQTHLGSAWNRAGTWEEKNLNTWASDRIKELLVSMGSLEFSGGRAEIAEVTRCSGDIQVKLSEDNDVPQEEQQSIRKDLKLFLQPIREKLLKFEEELKAR